MRDNSPCYPFPLLGSNGSNHSHTQGVRWLPPVTLPPAGDFHRYHPPAMKTTIPAPLPRPRRPRPLAPVVSREWWPPSRPVPDEETQLAAIAAELHRAGLV
jgi:hypothetical protein